MNENTMSSMTLHEALEIDEHLLDFISLQTEEQTTKFKNMFIARYDIYEIGGETIPLTKRFLTNKFNIYKDYYQELINDYENKINYLNGIVDSEVVMYVDSSNGDVNKSYNSNSNTDYIDLPNKTVSPNYVSKKDNTAQTSQDAQHYEDSKSGNKSISRNGGVNILEQKKEYQKYLRNVYLEFAERFKDCFVLVYN